ncbi:MAG: hypothetical protein HRS50_02435 [Mycoplasmataceae bacterium]|nr:hypothetical protein [Mycoplasmataceae bacterium]
MSNQIEIKKLDKQQKGIHKFDKGSVFSVLFKTAFPIVILMLFNTAYSFIDSLMSSTYVDYGTNDSGVQLNGGTSIGLVFPLMGILMAFQVMVAVGSGLAYTQSMSQKDYVGAKQRHNEALSMILYIGIITFVVIAIIGVPYLLTVSGNWNSQHWNDSTWEQGNGQIEWGMVMDSYYYMIILGVAFIPMNINQSYIRVLRAEGKGDIAALIPILTFPINIFLDWLLMSVFNFGLIGAGVATLAASLSGMILMFLYIWWMGKGDKLNIKLQWLKLRIHNEIAIIILTFAMGSLLRRIFDGITIATLSSYIGNIQVDMNNPNAIDVPNWTGSWTIMTRSINMGAMLSLGVAQSISMLVSYYSNLGEKEKLRQTIKYGFMLMIACSIMASMILMSLQGVLFNAYSKTSYGWEWMNSLSIAFTLALIYSIPVSLQPMPVMVYAGMKKIKLTLFHVLTFNGIVLLFSTLGLILNISLLEPLLIFVFMAIGAMFAFVIIMFMFKYSYKKLLLNLNNI